MGAFDGCGNEVVQEALLARCQLGSGRWNRVKTSEA
jgi:hypothetical protein